MAKSGELALRTGTVAKLVNVESPALCYRLGRAFQPECVSPVQIQDNTHRDFMKTASS